MRSSIITLSAIQFALIQYLPCVFCQYTFQNNAPVPPRFLVPGSFAVSNQNQPVQNKRLLSSAPQPQQQPIDDETLTRSRKPSIIRTRPGVGSTTHNFALDQESIFADQTPRVPLVREDDTALRSETVVDNSEDQTEETFASPLSTFEPTAINTVPFKTYKPNYFQSRPTKSPQTLEFTYTSSSQPQFFRPNTNLFDANENVKTSLEPSPRPVPSTEQTTTIPRRPLVNLDNTVQQFNRKQTPVNRVNNLQNKRTRIQPQQPQQPQPQQPLQPLSRPSEFSDNKILRQYEKVPAKTKFEKPEVPEKRGKKPVAQVLRRYREDNPDGSITWGFENDDGSYKEETIGNDCITHGKYGYIDPDGNQREYSYSQGLPCDKTKNEQEDEEKPATYIDYAQNKVVLANGESVDIDSMVKNRQRKPTNLRNQIKA